MMHFELCVNGKPVTKFSVLNKGPCPEIDYGKAHVYEWTSWRPNPDTQEIDQLTVSQVLHNIEDPIEELAFAVLTDWRRVRGLHDSSTQSVSQENQVF